MGGKPGRGLAPVFIGNSIGIGPSSMNPSSIAVCNPAGVEAHDPGSISRFEALSRPGCSASLIHAAGTSAEFLAFTAHTLTNSTSIRFTILVADQRVRIERPGGV